MSHAGPAPVERRTDADRHGSDTLTAGVRVRVRPGFAPDRSDTTGAQGTPTWVFVYRIRLVNEGQVTVRLRSRFWRIIDADGDEHLVEGEGVVGQQPRLAPGQSFEYTSFCPLTTPWGTMEGHFVFDGPEGDLIVYVGRFYLVSGE
jgi:ApaG protein